MTIEIRPIRPDEFDAYMRSGSVAFSEPIADEEIEAYRPTSEDGRDLAAFEDGRIVGGVSAASLRMVVPGGRTVAVGAVPHAAVLPTHRRQGINTSLFRAQLDDMRARGEPISALHASEAGIYDGLGYGMATMLGEFSIEVARTSFLPAHERQGSVRLLPREEALAPMRRVYDAVVPTRPGMIEITDPWFEWRYGEHGDGRSTPSFFAIHETHGEPDAYAVYRVKVRWPSDIPMHELEVRELMATTPQATMDMWRYVFDIDLIHTVKGEGRPPDEPLLWMLREPRRLHFKLSDGMFIRLVDVPAALEARGYTADGRVVIEVSDTFCPWNEGRFALEIEGEATCTPTDDEPDLACRVNELGSAYLGGASFAELARAGLVTERKKAGIIIADELFRTEQAPWCSLPF